MTVLLSEFGLSRAQVEAILDMRLQRLTGLERNKLEDEYNELVAQISDFKDILSQLPRRMQIIKEEMIELKEKYGDDRRTELIDIEGDLSIEDLIADEEMVITISHAGYIKRIPMDTYTSQNRGGKGITGMKTRDEDFVEHLFSASTHSYILFFTNRGKCYWLKVWEIPEAGRTARGKAMVNLLELGQGESIAAFLPIRTFDDEHYIMMVTRGGLVKKTVLSAYGNPRKNGIVALNILEGDALIEALLTSGDNDIVIASRNGQAVRFHEADVRTMGRGAQGVRGIRLAEGDRVVGMLASDRDATLLSVTENGYGKRTDIENYRLTRRASNGVSNIRTSERNGLVVSIHAVADKDELMIITMNGLIIRLSVSDLRPIGRNTQGVKLINLGEGDRVIDISKITPNEEEKSEDIENTNSSEQAD